MPISKKLGFFLLISLLFNNLKGQEIGSIPYQVINKMLDYELEEANQLIQQIDSAIHPHLYSFLKATYISEKHRFIFDQNDSLIETFNKHLIINNHPINHIDSLVNIYVSFLKLGYYNEKNNYWKGLELATSTYQEIKPFLAIKMEQIPLDYLFISSLYHYYYNQASINLKFSSLILWPFIEGDSTKGMKGLIKLSLLEEHIQHTPGLIALSKIYLREHYDKELSTLYSQKLVTKHPKNLKYFEYVIEANLITNNKTDQTNQMINSLLNSKSIYFYKYGIVYKALFESKSMASPKKEMYLEATLSELEQLGGGNHLKSLLYKALSDLQPNSNYSSLLKNTRKYIYPLTALKN